MLILKHILRLKQTKWDAKPHVPISVPVLKAFMENLLCLPE